MPPAAAAPPPSVAELSGRLRFLPTGALCVPPTADVPSAPDPRTTRAPEHPAAPAPLPTLLPLQPWPVLPRVPSFPLCSHTSRRHPSEPPPSLCAHFPCGNVLRACANSPPLPSSLPGA
eukprot:7431576-Karenia_brevis.AAC.1